MAPEETASTEGMACCRVIQTTKYQRGHIKKKKETRDRKRREEKKGRERKGTLTVSKS
jgi:hypothetical protein